MYLWSVRKMEARGSILTCEERYKGLKYGGTGKILNYNRHKTWAKICLVGVLHNKEAVYYFVEGDIQLLVYTKQVCAMST